MEILQRGSMNVLIALVISSFTLVSVTFQINSMYKKLTKLSYLSVCFLLSGLLMATGFSIPFIISYPIFYPIFFITTFGISLFSVTCIVLMYSIWKESR